MWQVICGHMNYSNKPALVLEPSEILLNYTNYVLTSGYIQSVQMELYDKFHQYSWTCTAHI